MGKRNRNEPQALLSRSSLFFPQDFLGSAATQFPEIITIVDVSISVLCNALFLIAIVYAFAAMALVIWPQSLVKVRLLICTTSIVNAPIWPPICTRNPPPIKSNFECI